MLAARKINKSYGDRPILVDCCAEIRPGECVLLRGPSGGGKTTLLRILALLETADTGTVTHGQTTWPANVPAGLSAYPFLTLVFQQLFLWPNLTMAQNLALVFQHGLELSLSERMLHMLDRFGISQILPRLPHECSLGERQRLALARALLSDAQFLLLDEPSSALDRANRAILVSELKIALEKNRGLLIVTHDDIGFAEIANKTLLLENGYLNAVAH